MSLCVTLLSCTASLLAQLPVASMPFNDRAPEPAWARHFGGPDDEGAYAVLALEDGYAIAGDCIDENGNRQMCLRRLGRYGDLLFEKHYAGSGISSARTMRATNDGGFVLAGSTRGSGGGHGTDLYIVKTDRDGDVEWSRVSQDRGGDFSEDILHARGGGFVSAGRNAVDSHGGYNVVKMNKPGTIVWTRNFPGEQANAIIELGNGHVAALGVTLTIPDAARPVLPEEQPVYPWEDPAKKKPTRVCEEEAAWLFTEVDWKGAVVRERAYFQKAYCVGHGLSQSDDGGYLMVGSINGCPQDLRGYDCWIVRTDSLGDTLWTRTFGGPGEDQAYSVVAEDDGGYVIAGATRSWGAGAQDVLLFKISKDGSMVWSTAIGGPGDDICYDVQLAEWGYVLSGTTTSYGEGDSDMYLVKVEPPAKR